MTAWEDALDGDRWWSVPARASARLRWERHDAGVHEQRMSPVPWLCGPDGGLVPGALCVLADSTLGMTLHRVMGERPLATTGLQLAFRWPRAPVTGDVVAIADHPVCEGDAGIVRGTVRDAAGTVLAHAVLTGLALSRRRAGAVLGVRGAPPQLPADAPPPPPDLGMSGDAQAPAFVARPAFGNIRGDVHGGVGALMVERALSAAARAHTDAAMAPLDLSVSFVRAIPADGARVAATAGVVHAGRRLLLASGRVHDARNRPALTGSLTMTPVR